MSSKNELQELCLRLHSQLPIYDTTRASGEDHAPVFHSTVTMPDGTSSAAAGSSKKKAELSAAACYLIDHAEEKPIKKLVHDNIRVFVDMENLPTVATRIHDNYDIRMVGFMSKKHALANRTYPFKVIYSEATGNDGTDIWMTMHIADYVNNYPYKCNIVIITNDHFGEAVQCYIYHRTQHGAVHLTSFEAFQEYLNNTH